MYRRARVGITLPCDSEKRSPIHIGHARTLLLGELISNYYGCSYHIRIDGLPYLYDIDRTPMILDLVNCLSFLGIKYTEMLPIASRRPTMTEMSEEIGTKRAEQVENIFNHPGFGPLEYQGVLTDDCFWHHRTLIIRGIEFKYPRVFWSTPPKGHSPTTDIPHVKAENEIYKAMGREKHEVNVPLIMTPGGSKVSKTDNTPLHWKILKGAPSYDVRSFLIATALQPTNPIGAIGDIDRDTLNPDVLSEQAYLWDWDVWNTLLISANEKRDICGHQ